MNRLKLSIVVAIPIMVLCCAAPAAGQSGVIQGTVLDQQGASIVNAKVVAFDEAKALLVRETTTKEDGSFQLLPLLQGRYTVTVESAGFARAERKGLVLDPQQIMNLGRIEMAIGAAAESIRVEATAPVVETSTAQKSFMITSRQVSELSLNGRDFATLMKTLPGVVSNEASDFRMSLALTNTFNVNGMRSSANNVFLDGSINTDVGGNDSQYTQLSMDAVGEFKVQTSAFNAEYGRSTGVMIAATTKSGGSAFHGTLYEFMRNDAMDANNFFNNMYGSKKTMLRFNQFGGNIGGPVILPRISPRGNPKLFFFFNYEGTRGTKPNWLNYVQVPHPDVLNGDFRRLFRTNADGSPVMISGSQYRVGTIFQPGTVIRNAGNNIIGGVPFPDNIIPKSMWSKNAPAFVKVLQNPMLDYSRGQALATQPEMIRIPYQDVYRLTKDQKALRVDYNLNTRTNAFFRWVDDGQTESQRSMLWGWNPLPFYPMGHGKPGASWAWNVVNVISPTMTNEVIVTYNHLTQFADVKPGTDPATYDRDKLGFTFQELYPESNTRNKFPSFGCGDMCAHYPFNSGWRTEGRTYAVNENFTKVFGAHTFKTGFFWNMNSNGQQPTWQDTPNLNFDPNAENPMDAGHVMANLLLGNYSSVQQSRNIAYGTFRFFGFESYAQDSWKVNRKLTLEYGVRHVYLGPTYTYGKYLMYYFKPELYDPSKAVSLVTAAGQLKGSLVPGVGNPFNGTIQENSPGLPSGGVKHRWNQFSPRFGFAYDPFGNGKTSIRGGFGSFYERIVQGMYFGGLGNPPNTYSPKLYGGNIDNLSPSLVAGGTAFPVTIDAFNADGFLPTIYSWTFGVQRQMPGNISVDVAYVGNIGRHLLYRTNLNNLPVGTTVNSSVLTGANNTTNAIRPYKGYESINYTDMGANSNFHSLQARVSRRFAKNLTANVSYTWGKAMGVAEKDNDTIPDIQNRDRDYGPLNYDRQHVLNIDYVYQLPSFTRNRIAGVAANGWQISGITRFWSGSALTLNSNGNPGSLGTTGVRADYYSGSLYPAEKTRLEWFNPLAFGRPRDGSLGNTGRGILRGPGVNDWSVSVFKNTRLSERVTTQLRLETFNTFNHTQWGTVNLNLSGPNPGQQLTQATRGTVGQVQNTRDPRTIQLGFKLLF